MFAATLNVGQEVTRPKGTKVGASGSFLAVLDGTELTWTLEFARLSGPATGAHLHFGGRGKNGPIVVTLCGLCSSSEDGTTTLTQAQVASLLAGNMDVNAHTAKNPNGEIRGQVRRTS